MYKVQMRLILPYILILRRMGTEPYFSKILLGVTTFVILCLFSRRRNPSKMGSTLKGKDFAFREVNPFILRVYPRWEGKKNENGREQEM